jgi:hypothetical protein
MSGEHSAEFPMRDTTSDSKLTAMAAEAALQISDEQQRPGGDRGANDVRTWARIGQVAGYVAGGGFFLGTLLFLADASDVLASSPQFQATPAGLLQDDANYFAAFFAHQHQILWDIALRDGLFPLAYLALVVLAVALTSLVDARRPDARLMTLFFLVGGIWASLDALTYLGNLTYWAISGWSSNPAAAMVAVGRASEAIGNETQYFQVAGFVALAAGLLCLGHLCRTWRDLPSRLGILARLEAFALLGAAAASALSADVVYNVLSLVVGVVLAPAVAIWLGLSLSRRSPFGSSSSSPDSSR